MYFSLPGALVGLALVAGLVMAPVRAIQALSGRLLSRSSPAPKSLGLATLLFVLAFLFWCAALWAAYNIEFAHTCSGDTCIGYMLLAMPFPFVYALAEFLLLRARRAASAGTSSGGKTAP